MFKSLSPQSRSLFDLKSIADLPKDLQERVEKNKSIKFNGKRGRVITLFTIKNELNACEVAVGLYRLASIKMSDGAIKQMFYQLQKDGVITRAKKPGHWTIKPEVVTQYHSKGDA